MKTIAYWGSNHKTAARIIIVISFILLTFLGFFTGTELGALGITLSAGVLTITILIYLAAVLCYPHKHEKGTCFSREAFFVRQKLCDFLLAASTFSLIVCTCNKPSLMFQSSTQAMAVSIQPSGYFTVRDSTYKSIKEFHASMKDENGKLLKWKERKKLLKDQVKAIKKSNTLSKEAKFLLITLAVIAALGLMSLIAALACELSCSGSEALAWVVFLGGTTLIIVLLVFAIRKITGKKPRKKEKI